MIDTTSGLIFNIQRYSIHDGGGVRTLVFMKGCPLSCLWCSNPEGQRTYPEIGYIGSNCVGVEVCSGRCLNNCKVEAISLSKDGKPVINRTNCNGCGDCARDCYYGALKIVGKKMTLNEVLQEVEKDRPFYRRSGGGITVGGGEPLMQGDFVISLLKICHNNYLHTAIETCGLASWQHLEEALDYVDLVYFDLKHIDDEKHIKLTGSSNEIILENAKKMMSAGRNCQVVIRIPVVPDCNDSVENIRKLAGFSAGLGYKQIELIPYHKLGIAKYCQYGMDYRLHDTEAPTAQYMQRLKSIVESQGLKEITGVL